MFYSIAIRSYSKLSVKSKMKSKLTILWYRNDLRLLDNQTLNRCFDLIDKKKTDFIIPFYCFDKDLLDGQSRVAQLPRCGPIRRAFLIESVVNLKDNLINKLKSNLYIANGQADVELVNLIDQLNKTADGNVINVVASKEIASEEIEMENKIRNILKLRNISLDLIWDSTMIHIDDLPFYGQLNKISDMFTGFRKSVEINGEESNYNVRKPVNILKQLSTCQLPDWGHDKIPEKLAVQTIEKSAINGFKGGEDAALERMNYYFFKSDGLSIYKTTRNGLIGKDYSSKLSIWLALGCVSARYLYWKVKEFEQTHRSNESTRAFIFELLWRDFFKFHSYKYGRRLFYLHGCFTNNRASNYAAKWKTDIGLFEKWCKGETGYPFVDANMKELNATGWMSNRGRQNVASFLTKDLEIDWRYGAEYFEMMLVDYDCTSNWGNWQYVAGVGTDPRQDRYFNVIKQAYDYDENGDYVKMWLPVLQSVSNEYVHCPFLMNNTIQRINKFELGKDYPMPIVRMKFEWKPNAPRKVNKFAARSSRNRDF